ncbi:MAG: 4a-hydroxytetrahydrobiopterin dehydratase [Planctomycetota bacterium]
MTARDDGLAERRCAPCRRGTPPLSVESAMVLLEKLGGWKLTPAARSLFKEYRFESYAAALEFVNSVAALAEAENHHPDLLLSWRKVRVELTTHAAGGVTDNDFILAAKIDRVVR